MFFYDLEINLSWKAFLGDRQLTGKYRIPSVCDDDPITEKNIRISTTEKSKEGDLVKAALLKEGTERLIKLFNEFLEETREHFQEPLPGEPPKQRAPSSSQETTNEAPKSEPAESKPVEKPAAPVSKSFKSLSTKVQFDCSPELMYECLLDDRRLAAFTQSSAQMDRTEGGSFSLFGGQVVGTNKELVKNAKIVQNWRFKTWKEGHYSLVTITLKPESSGTIVELTQTKIPIEDFERTKEGWKSHFWARIRGTFGFPYRTL